MKYIVYYNAQFRKYLLILLGIVGFMLISLYAHPTLAAQTIGDVAANITESMSDLAKLVTAGSYVAGFGFAVGAILKFKAHKDNPTQIPVGTPIALIFIAAALIFLPTIFGVSGETMFGSDAETGTVGGVSTFG